MSNCFNLILAWIGFLFINFGFVILITWGMQHFPVVGISLSCTYTLFLFILTCFITKEIIENDNDEIPNVTPNHPSLQISNKINHWFHILLQLTYTLGILSFAMTGFFISTYTFHNCHSYDFFMEQDRLWDKTLTKFPPYIQEWAKAADVPKKHINFVYFPSTGITILNGMKDDYDKKDGWMLWKLSKLDIPYPISEIRHYKSEFVSISEDTKCFTFKGPLDQYPIDDLTKNQTNIACSDDGQTFRFPLNTSIIAPHNLFVSDSILWIQDMIHLDTKFSKKYIYSMNVSLMKETIHIVKIFDRTLSKDTEISNECTKNHILRHRAIRGLLFSIGIVFLSICLWKYKNISTMPTMIYLGLTSISITIYLIVYPHFSYMKSYCQWWFGISSALYLGLLFASFITQHMKSTTYKMSLTFISLIFVSSHISLIGIFEFNNESEWYRWILINLFTFFPLIGIGTISEHTFVIGLGFLGLFLDVWKIAYEFTERSTHLSYYPIYFALLAIAGGMIGSFAWLIHTYQEALCQWVFMSLNGRIEIVSHPTKREDSHSSSSTTHQTHQECEICP